MECTNLRRHILSNAIQRLLFKNIDNANISDCSSFRLKESGVVISQKGAKDSFGTRCEGRKKWDLVFIPFDEDFFLIQSSLSRQYHLHSILFISSLSQIMTCIGFKRYLFTTNQN